MNKMQIRKHSVKILALTLVSVAGLAGGVVNMNTVPTPVKAISINDPLSRIAPHGRETITVHDNQATFSSDDISRLDHHQSILEGSDRLGRNGTAEARLSERTAKKPGSPGFLAVLSDNLASAVPFLPKRSLPSNIDW